MTTTYNPVAYVEMVRSDAETGEEYHFVEEFAIVDITSDIYHLLSEQFGARWASNSTRASLVILTRSYRAYETGYRNLVDWTPFDLAEDRQSALESIAWSRCHVSTENGNCSLVKAASGCKDMADCLDRLERERREQLEEEAKRKQERHEQRVRYEQQQASKEAFIRMRDGSSEGQEMAEKWNTWARSMREDSDRFDSFKSDLNKMKLYADVMDATTVPKKRKAIRLLLNSVGA